MTNYKPAPAPQRPTDGPIHEWFGLSYCNYVVISRSLLQSMPVDFQKQMVAALERLDEAFAHIERPDRYRVEAATEHIVREMTEAELAEAGIFADWYAGENPPEGLSAEDFAEWRAEHEQDAPDFYRIGDGEELDPHSRVLLPVPDPVPHYNRGRTYIAPRLEAGEPDFFRPGLTYRRRRWHFQCLAVAPNPFNGEKLAVGFLYRPGEPASATSMDEATWEHDGWTESGETA